MRITLIIPDETILLTASIATQTDKNEVSLGVFPITSADLKDGNTVDFKTPYDNRKGGGEE